MMANLTVSQEKNGKYLWFALLGMGFQPEAAMLSVAGKNSVKHINLGPNMFDKPNKDAAYIVIHFLLNRLNPTKFHEVYRYCWPVLDHKADAEFRKVTCIWLREIMETANAGSKVVASLFLSPGGAKFTSLMLNLACHVMQQEMKSFSTDDSWAPETAAIPASSLDMARKRLKLTSKRFLKAAVDQDHFLQEYQRRAELLQKSVRDIRAGITKYDDLLKRHSSNSTHEGASRAEKIKKVRSLWSAIDEMLATTKEGQEAVESVLKGDVDQYILDGTDRVLKVPQPLLKRIEGLSHQLTSGNVYEAGQLNILCVLELMNHALQILREERGRLSDAPKPQLSPQHLQEKSEQMARVLQELHLIRQKISREEIPEVRSTIRELEAQWDQKWMETLKEMPLDSFLNEDPALDFLSPMAPLSFKPAAEASNKNSVFSQYPAKLLEEKPAESESHEEINPSNSALKRMESPVVTIEASRVNTSLDWLFDTPPSPTPRASPAPPQAPQASVRKTACALPKVAPVKTKTQIIDMECDNLADQFADAVTTTSPTGSIKGVDLQGLLSTLHGDPFSTRKQLPRTPESLILDVKSSWHKAVEENKLEKIRQLVNFDDSISGRLTPLEEHHVLLSSDVPSKNSSSCTPPDVTSPISPPVNQQEVLPKSTISWDTFDSLSGTCSSAVQFNLDHETLPEMSSCDSLLSVDDEAVDMKSEKEEEELLIPSLKIEKSPLTTAHHWGQTQQACDGSFIETRSKTPECLLSGRMVSLDRDGLMEPVKSVGASDRVFSLDLDALETPTPPKKQSGYSLPKLITFSPIDDMKC